jgi:D-sedoheptulose 7-phosphate isomerase
MTYAGQFLEETQSIIGRLDLGVIEQMASMVANVRERGGRLFFLGVGGGAGHASHAVNDFRKIAGIEAYTPTDNVSELTARANDDGWDTVFAAWLRGSRLNASDMVLVFSVGGGDVQRGVSTNLVRALEYARSCGASIGGIVGPRGGFTAEVADTCLVIPATTPSTVTPQTEALQAVVWHLLVSHPLVKQQEMKWESIF